MRIPMMFALVVLCSGPAAAQGIGAGVRGGVNLANVTFDSEDGAPSFDPRTGIVAGGFVILPVFSWLEVQPEVLYTSKGAKLDDEGVKASLVLDYVEVPILARASRALSGRSRLYAVAGPTVGFNVRARSRTEFSGSTEEMDISSDVERLDIGVAAGAGLEFGALTLDGRYTFGLSDIDKDTTDAVTIKNRAFSITVGFRF